VATWDSAKLLRHYQKHPCGQCLTCWQQALDQPRGGPPIPLPDYAKAADSTLQAPWFAFAADYSEASWQPLEKTEYYVDKRMLVTVVQKEQDRIKTCFRAHSWEGQHDLETSVDARIRLIERFNSWKYSTRKTLSNPEQLIFKPRLPNPADYDALNKKVSEFLERPRTPT